MSHDLGHKKCGSKVFVMFCYLDEKVGRCLVLHLWSLVLGTSESTEAYSSSQIYNQCSISAGEKNDHASEQNPVTELRASF